MAWIMRDFFCKECDDKFESLVKSDELQTECPACSTLSDSAPSAPMFGQMNDPEKKAEVLKKRSEEHSKKEFKHNAEKFGMQSRSIGNYKKK